MAIKEFKDEGVPSGLERAGSLIEASQGGKS